MNGIRSRVERGKGAGDVFNLLVDVVGNSFIGMR